MHNLVSLSKAKGGQGVSLPNKRALTQLGTPLSIGQSPSYGTSASVFLQTNHDLAYDNAVITFRVKQFGKSAIWNTQAIAPADNASMNTLVYVADGFAADFWEVEITLTNGLVPAQALESSVTASGCETLPAPTGGGLVYTGAAPIIVTGTVISIDPSFTPWRQIGGVGGIIEAIDATASVEASHGTATAGQLATAFGAGTATGYHSFAVGLGTASKDDDAAFGGGRADGGYAFAAGGGTANGPASFAAGGSFALGERDTAFGLGSTANSAESAVAFAGGTATGAGSLAGSDSSIATAAGAFAWGNSQADGVDSFAAAFGLAQGLYSAAFDASATGDFSFAASAGVASGVEATAFGGGDAAGIGSFAAASGAANYTYDAAFGLGSIATSTSVGSAFAAAGGNALYDYAVAFGLDIASSAPSMATNESAFALAGATASGVGSIAHGFTSSASGFNDAAFGTNSLASGGNSASFGGGNASGPGAFAAAAGTASAFAAFAAGGGTALGPYSAAFGFGYTNDSQDFAACGGFAGTGVSPGSNFAVGPASLALGGFSAAVANGIATSDTSFAACYGQTNASGSAAFGLGSLTAGGYAFAQGGGYASATNAFAAAGGQAEGDNGAAIGNCLASQIGAVVLGNGLSGPTFAQVSIGNDPLGEQLVFQGAELAFFGVAPVVQQTGGAAVAGGLYTAVEQGMLNRMYAALQAYGLLT